MIIDQPKKLRLNQRSKSLLGEAGSRSKIGVVKSIISLIEAAKIAENAVSCGLDGLSTWLGRW